MSLDPISAALDIGGKLIDRVFPDPVKRDAAKLELLKMQQSGELQVLAAAQAVDAQQSATNLAEAQSPDWWRGGWRPAIGWVCATALACQYVARPVAEIAATLIGHPLPGPLPGIDDELWQLMLGMLGLGGLRTFERIKGKA